MNSRPEPHSSTAPMLAWLTTVLAGVIAPALALVVIASQGTSTLLPSVSGSILAISLMGSGMIAAATSGRFWIGVLLAIVAGSGLTGLAYLLGLPALPDSTSTGLAFVVASVSFAARGALFARSGAGRGWLIAICVVAGEAAVVLTAVALPGAWPEWILALLPAQWATAAIQTSLTGAGAGAAIPVLLALGGTAMATMLVWWLWPRRWTYGIMFTVWLGLSALVYHSPAPPTVDTKVGGEQSEGLDRSG